MFLILLQLHSPNKNSESGAATSAVIFATEVEKMYTGGSIIEAGMVAHPVTQVIGEQALVDILDLSEVAWT